jgi:hypothetical protein
MTTRRIVIDHVLMDGFFEAAIANGATVRGEPGV